MKKKRVHFSIVYFPGSPVMQKLTGIEFTGDPWHAIAKHILTLKHTNQIQKIQLLEIETL